MRVSESVCRYVYTCIYVHVYNHVCMSVCRYLFAYIQYTLSNYISKTVPMKYRQQQQPWLPPYIQQQGTSLLQLTIISIYETTSLTLNVL